MLKGIAVRHVGLTPGRADQAGECVFADPPTDTPSGVRAMAVVVMAGPVAGTMVGETSGVESSDMRMLDKLRGMYTRLAPGQAFPNAVSRARAELADPLTWRGVLALARSIVVRGGTLTGAEAEAAVRAAWRAGS